VARAVDDFRGRKRESNQVLRSPEEHPDQKKGVVANVSAPGKGGTLSIQSGKITLGSEGSVGGQPQVENNG